MEWTIPLQTFEVGKVRIGNLTIGPKRIVPLTYIDGELRFPSLSILLPIATVKAYDATTGRLSLLLQPNSIAMTRLRTFQETLIQSVLSQQKAWFPGDKLRTIEEIRGGFQSMMDGDNINLYCPSTLSDIQDICVYTKGGWTRGVKASYLQPGSSVRLAIRIQGLSFHQYPGTGGWSGKFRLQHRVLSVLSKA